MLCVSIVDTILVKVMTFPSKNRACVMTVTLEYKESINIIFFLFPAMILDAILFSAAVYVSYPCVKIDQSIVNGIQGTQHLAPPYSPPHIPNR